MNRFEWIIYILLVILFLLYFYFIVNEKKIFEGVVDSGLSLSDETVFGKNVEFLKAANKNLENSLDKIDKTYGDLTKNKDQYMINEQTINNQNKNKKELDDKILEVYKLITNTEPIIFLKLNSNNNIAIPSIPNSGFITNAANQDERIKNIKSIYDNIIAINLKTVQHFNKYCLKLYGSNIMDVINRQFVLFFVLPTIPEFSFSFWIFNDSNVNNDNDPVISIMNDIDFEKNDKKSGLQLYIKNNLVDVHYNNTTLKSDTMQYGWNHVTFTTKYAAYIYINGTNIKSSMTIATPLQPVTTDFTTQYRLNTCFIIGGNNYKGYIYNVRYYTVEIPKKVVEDIYNLDVNTNANS
jgi:hypothetical protein